MKNKINKAEEYTNRFNEKWGNKYLYPNEIYSSTDEINITCPEHGDFKMQAYRHLMQQCPNCGVRGDSFKTFTERAKAKFGNKFIYVKETYTTAQDKMDIICPTHGKFQQALYSHVRLSHGCPQCGYESSATHSRDDLETFIAKAKEVHGNRYDYSKVNYVNSLTSVEIYCKVHNQYFNQQPASHIRGRGCNLCGDERGSELRTYTNKEFIDKIKLVQGDEYDYSQVEYTGIDNKVKLICKEHGEFYKNPRDLLNKKTGCSKCAGNYIYTTEEYIAKAKEVHGDKYGYSKTKYVKAQDKVIITCPIHGDFLQVASGHIACNYGCPKCSGAAPVTQEEFITRSKEIHKDKYLYEKVKFTDMKTKVILTCKKHGEFKSTPSDHIYSESGCPKCSASKGELYIHDYLKKYNIRHETEYKIPGNRYKYDFYLNDYGVFIEFHGTQHYEYNRFFHKTYDSFVDRKIIDDIKIEVVKANSGKLIVVPYPMLEQGTIDQYLKRSLIRHGVPKEVFFIDEIKESGC